MTHISVIIPAYNCQAYLQEAIESVLSQKMADLEIIVIDDGSTDGTAFIAASYAPFVICVSQKNMGIGAARNRGVNLAQGKFFAFLDADDLWTENKLSRQLALFKADPHIDALFGHAVQFISQEISENPYLISTEPVPAHLPGTLLIRRENFFKVGLFCTEHLLGEGVEWYGRLLQSGLNIVLSKEIFLKRRVHNNNSVTRHKSSYRDYVWHLKRLLDKKRGKERADLL